MLSRWAAAPAEQYGVDIVLFDRADDSRPDAASDTNPSIDRNSVALDVRRSLGKHRFVLVLKEIPTAVLQRQLCGDLENVDEKNVLRPIRGDIDRRTQLSIRRLGVRDRDYTSH